MMDAMIPGSLDPRVLDPASHDSMITMDTS